MKKTMTRWMLGLVLPAFMAVAPQASAADIKQRNFRFSFVQPLDSHMGYGAQRFAELVKEKSDGKMSVKLFPNGTLGGDLQTVSALQGGTLDLTTLPPGLLVGLNPKYGVFDLPFLFETFAEADAVLDGEVGERFLRDVPKGLVGLTYWDHGFRNVSNSKRPIAKLEDMNGLKIRVVQAPMVVDTFTALGTNPVPMAFTELYTAMETGAVDGQDNPVVAFETNRFNEVQKHLSLTKHVYNPLILLFSEKTWNRLSQDERQILLDAAKASRVDQRRVSREMETKAIEKVRAAGTTVTEVSPSEVARMREATSGVTGKYVDAIGQDEVSAMQAAVKAVRK
jgi:tripartite ATP-independent transporter DctP family solute receptor